MTNLTEIVDKFRIDGIVKSIDPLGSGLINDTYKITTQSSDTDDYVLQRINHAIFKDVDPTHYILLNLSYLCSASSSPDIS